MRNDFAVVGSNLLMRHAAFWGQRKRPVHHGKSPNGVVPVHEWVQLPVQTVIDFFEDLAHVLSVLPLGIEIPRFRLLREKQSAQARFMLQGVKFHMCIRFKNLIIK